MNLVVVSTALSWVMLPVAMRMMISPPTSLSSRKRDNHRQPVTPNRRRRNRLGNAGNAMAAALDDRQRHIAKKCGAAK